MELMTKTTEQAILDKLYTDFCAANGIVMDSDYDRADYAARGHLYLDGGSDVHDGFCLP